MKFAINRAVALHTLSQLLKTCNVKAKGDPDSEFLFRVKKGKLYATSINDKSEQTLLIETTRLDAEDGTSFSANGQAIVEYVKLFPDDELGCMYDADDHQFLMGSKVRTARFALPTPEETDFVPMNFTSAGGEIVCDATILAEALRSTAFAASMDAQAAPLTAVRLTISNDGLLAEAMDNFRISRYEIQMADLATDTIQLLVPRETAEALSSLLEGVGQVSIQPGVSHVRVKWDETIYTSRLEAELPGKKFPNVSSAFNGDEQGKVKVSKAEVQRALKTLGLITKDSYVSLGVDKVGLSMSLSEAAKGAAREVVVAQELEGETTTYVGWKYISKAVDSTK